jgi:hypothetical protein
LRSSHSRYLYQVQTVKIAVPLLFNTLPSSPCTYLCNYRRRQPWQLRARSGDFNNINRYKNNSLSPQRTKDWLQYKRYFNISDFKITDFYSQKKWEKEIGDLVSLQYKRYFKLSDFNISGVSCMIIRYLQKTYTFTETNVEYNTNCKDWVLELFIHWTWSVHHSRTWGVAHKDNSISLNANCVTLQQRQKPVHLWVKYRYSLARRKCNQPINLTNSAKHFDGGFSRVRVITVLTT